MIEGPDLDKAVFVRCLGVKRSNRRFAGFDAEDEDMNGLDEADAYDSVEVSCGFTNTEEGTQDGARIPNGAERFVNMQRGDIWIVRWRSVRESVARGECELI